MAATSKPTPEASQPPVYQIRIKGHLAPQWESWFCSMVLTSEAHGNTVLSGEVIDQAALHGLLRKIRDLGLPLLSVTQVEPGTNDLDTHHRKDTT